MSRPVQSTNTQTSNVLLKVTVPKRTGRKRKRGSNEPFTNSQPETTESRSNPVTVMNGSIPQRRDAGYLLRSLRDNVDAYNVEPVGKVDRSHVFRGELHTIIGGKNDFLSIPMRD